MDGVTVVVSNDSSAAVLIEQVSEELKCFLQETLAAFCHGAAQVKEDAAYYSFESTIEEFLKRFDPKPDPTKIGMAGELITHILMPLMHSHLSSSAVFFNKEERSIKKGFDLTFFEGDTNLLWYAEVKAGKVAQGQSADQKSTSLLAKAAADVADKLGVGHERSRWNSAIIDAALTLESNQARTVKILLRSDANCIKSGAAIRKNVVLGATVIHPLQHCRLTAGAVSSAVDNLAKSGAFDALRVLVIQQDAVETIVNYLRSVVGGTSAQQ